MFNTPPPLSRKTKIVILILVLLIHLLLLIPFVTTNFTFLPKSPLEQKVKELHKKVHKLEEPEPEEWGTLKSRAMQMSAPVILVDDSAATQAMADKSDADKPSVTQDIANKEDNDKNNQVHDEPETQEETEQKPAEPDIQQPILIDIPDQEGTRLMEQKKEEKPLHDEKKSTPPTPPKPRPQTPAKPTVQPKRPATKPRQPAAAKTMVNKQLAQPKLSLAQLAQGFVDHMQHEGDYTISMSGHDNAKATESQLRIGRFLQRIIGSVQNAWRSNVHRYPLSHPVIVSIHFTIVINKDGSLNKVNIDKSSGNQSIDNYIKLIIQDASSSFSAIPNYMSHDICSIRCTLDDIRLPEGPPGYTIRQ